MAKKNSGLGRSFYEVFDDNLIENKKGLAENLRISSIEPRKDQPRKTFERESLEALAESIGAYGVLQPIIVRQLNSPGLEDTYEIIAGERRWRAAKMAGLSEIPAIVFDGDDLRAAQVAMIENIQREDLNPIEEAMGYEALIKKFGLTQDQVAKQVGKSRSAVTNILRLLDLPDDVLELVKTGDLSAGHARALLPLDEETASMFATKIVEKNMSVREVEALVKRLLSKAEPSEEKIHPQIKIHMKELEACDDPARAEGKDIPVGKKRVVELSYDNDSDLEAASHTLCGQNIFSEVG